MAPARRLWGRLTPRRRSTRMDTNIPATLRMLTSMSSATVVNGSTSGFLIRTDEFAQVGDACRLHLYTHLGELYVQGEVVRLAPGHVAVRLSPLSEDQQEQLARALCERM